MTDKYEMLEALRQHVDAAMKEMAERKSSQKQLEDEIFKILKSIKSDGNFDKNKPITW